MAEGALLRDETQVGAAGGGPGGHGAPGKPGGSDGDQQARTSGLLRTAAAPLVAAALIISLLFAWTITGGAGTLRRVRITVGLAAIPVPLIQRPGARQPDVTTYLVIRSPGSPDELIGASTPKAAAVIFVRNGRQPFASGGRLTSIAVPAAGVNLSPFGVDIVLLHPAALQSGEVVPVTLRFRNAGRVVVNLQVTNSLANPAGGS